MAQPSNAATPDDTSHRHWRQYWCFQVPVLASLHASFLLGALLLAHAIGGGSGGAIGGLTTWFLINAWQARPGAQNTLDWRTHGRRHTPGVINVKRDAPMSARLWAPEPVTAAPPARSSSPSRRQDVPSITWAGVMVTLDVTVVAVLATAVTWAPWVSVLAVLLLAVHLWLAYQVLRGALRRRRATVTRTPSPTRSGT